MLKNQKKLNDYAKEAGVSIEQLQKAASNKDGEKTINALSEAMGVSADKARDFINNYSGAKVTEIAHALGLTREQLENMSDQLGFLSSSDVINGIDGLVEKFTSLAEISKNLS